MIRLQLENAPSLAMNLGKVDALSIGLGSGGGFAPVRDYELLENKPQINGVELIGNILLPQLISGLIIDGGDAEGGF